MAVEYIVQPKDYNGKAGEIRESTENYFKGAPTFYPFPLPDTIAWNDRLFRLVNNASEKLAELSTIARTWTEWKGMPNPHRLFEGFMKQEAISSSRIEGTKTSYKDVLRMEAAVDVDKTEDDKVVLQFIDAMDFGFKEIRKGTPLSTQFLTEMHRILLNGNKTAGRIRTEQNYLSLTTIEAATFIPPAPQFVPELLVDFDAYLQKENELPSVVRAALLHYQFETIHPFVDGNGRIGRALIQLYLKQSGKTGAELLYLSPYLEKFKGTYKERLLDVSQKGTYEKWVEFFVTGVTLQSKDAIERTNRLVRLREKYLAVLDEKKFPASADAILDFLFQNPITTIKNVTRATRLTPPTVESALDRMIREGIVQETTGQKRNREYKATAIFNEYDNASKPT